MQNPGSFGQIVDAPLGRRLQRTRESYTRRLRDVLIVQEEARDLEHETTLVPGFRMSRYFLFDSGSTMVWTWREPIVSARRFKRLSMY